MPDSHNTGELQEPRRRWFQFRLQTLLVVVVLLGAACGYVAHEASIVRARKAWQAAHTDAWFAERVGYRHYFLKDEWSPSKDSPSMIRRLLGDVDYGWIGTYSEHDADEAKRLFPEAEFGLLPTAIY